MGVDRWISDYPLIALDDLAYMAGSFTLFVEVFRDLGTVMLGLCCTFPINLYVFRRSFI
jgi:hypothetical protein